MRGFFEYSSCQSKSNQNILPSVVVGGRVFQWIASQYLNPPFRQGMPYLARHHAFTRLSEFEGFKR